MEKPRVIVAYSACPLTRAAFEQTGCDAFTCDLLPAREGYTWLEKEVLWHDDLFIVTRSPGCWPTTTKLELALFEPAAPVRGEGE